MNGENNHTEQTERILTRYRLVGPTAELRARILREAEPRSSRWAVAAWLAAAAVLVLTLGLHLAAQRITRQTMARLSHPVQWTAPAEEAAQLFNGQGSVRHYLALALAAGGPRGQTLQPADAVTDFSRELR